MQSERRRTNIGFVLKSRQKVLSAQNFLRELKQICLTYRRKVGIINRQLQLHNKNIDRRKQAPQGLMETPAEVISQTVCISYASPYIRAV